MPPRLNKRQQREQEELSILSATRGEHDDDEAGASKPTVLGFAALALQNTEQHEEEEEEEEEEDLADDPAESGPKKTKKRKKKKKKASVLQPTDADASGKIEVVPEPPVSAVKKKAGKKAKTKDSVDEGDDIDKALARLALENPVYKQVATLSQKGKMASFFDKQNSLLSVSLSHLDADAEMRKFFGSKVVGSSTLQSKPRRGGRAAGQSLKSNLTKPADSWGTSVYREGLSIRQLTPEELVTKERIDQLELPKTDKWWRVEYSRRYRSVTKAFVDAVSSGDPERFFRILAELPWHADTLLQLSEVCRHREEHATTVDYLSRALFTYERSLMGAFAFTAGTNRLDFNCVENRPFFLAVSRMITDLQRRGCSRTAFEFARLLFSLDPYTDPHGALLHLDYLSVRSGMQDWLLSMWDLHDAEAQTDANGLWHRFNVTALPGWSYGRALALRVKDEAGKGGHDASDLALVEAITAFPSIVPLLADKVDAFLPGDIRGHSSFRVHVDASSLNASDSLLHLLSHLYAQRSASLWKVPERASWLKDTAISVFQKLNTKKQHTLRTRFDRQFCGEGKGTYATASDLLQSRLALSIYRHASTLPDANLARRLTSFFPRELTNAPSFSYDPLPPFSATSYYDNSFFEGTQDIFAYRPRTKRERELDQRNLARMIPDANVRHQLQAVYDAHPELQAQFPQGILQFAQVAVGMGEDFFDILMPHVVGPAGGGGVNRMPGQLGEVDDFDEDVAGDNDEADVDIPENVAHEGDRDDADEMSGSEGESGEDDDEENQEAPPTLPVRVWQNLINRFWGGAPGG